MQEKEASYQEHMKQLTEKMEKERAQLIADQERVLALKLQVFNCSISILSSTVMNQKLLKVRASYQFKDCSSPNTSRHFIPLLLLPLTISGYWSLSCCLVAKLSPTPLWPHGLLPTRLFCPWDFRDKNTGVSCHFLLQGILPTQGSNTGVLHFRQILYHLRHQEIPYHTLNYIPRLLVLQAVLQICAESGCLPCNIEWTGIGFTYSTYFCYLCYQNLETWTKFPDQTPAVILNFVVTFLWCSFIFLAFWDIHLGVHVI